MRRICLAAAAALMVAPVASAIPDEDAGLWSMNREGQLLQIDVVSLSSGGPGEDVRVSLVVRNTSDQRVENMLVSTRRGEAVESAADIRTQMATGTFPYWATRAEIAGLEPGAEERVELTVPTALDKPATLAVTEPGVYPLMFALTGEVDGVATNLSEERLALSIGTGEVKREALSLIYPVSAPVDIVPGETGGEGLILASEELAGQLAPEGRLNELIDAYLDADLRGAGCVALDPALVDAASRMAEGYTVATERPSITQPPKRLRDSWTSESSDSDVVPGTGSQDARAWLDKLRQLDCVMAVPWANADISAVVAAHNDFLTYEAVERGAETIKRVTGKDVASKLVVPGSGYVSEEIPVPVLVADNSTWRGQAATFDASLGALLAQTGDEPKNAGYTNPQLRYDYRLDSRLSRDLTAEAALRAEAARGQVVAVLPNMLDAQTGRAILATAEGLIRERLVTPRPVRELRVQEGRQEGHDELGSPYEDPAIPAIPDVARVEQQARYADELMDIMVNAPDIALTRYGFTLPLRRDLLTALSITGRASVGTHDEAVASAEERLDRNSTTLQELRSSVMLVPPGNVYTRVSESSPLLIVAQNGLPLPVKAQLGYSGPEGAQLNTPDTVQIPAKGSITVTMTADLPTDADRSDLRLWLATPAGATISTPISIAVQTRAGIVSVYGAGAIAAVAMVFALLFRLGRKKRSK